jgi:hypothetical protein
MYWTTTTGQGSQVADIRDAQILDRGSLRDQSNLGDQPPRPSAMAPKAEPCLRPPRPDAGRGRPPAHSHCRAAFEFSGRAGLCIPGIPDGPAGFKTRHIEAARSVLPLALNIAKGALFLSRQVFTSGRAKLPNPHCPEPPVSGLPHRVSARQYCRVEPPLTCSESATSVFLLDTFSGGPFSAAESACGADASHTLPSRIHFPKGLR